MCRMLYKCRAFSVQFSMCSMKCTGAAAGEFVGSGTVHSVHCAVCSVLPATEENLSVEKG